MTISDTHIAEILHTLAMCGLSGFNIMIRRDGLVIFWSQGLKASEIVFARECLVIYLQSVTES